MKVICWLQDITIEDSSLVGAKALRLGRVMQAGLRVPPGFCLTTQAYRAHMAAIGLEHDLRLLAAATDNQAEDLIPPIQQAICSSALSAAIAEPLLENFSKLQKMQPGVVAVRSSATTEDLPTASYAGLQATTLSLSEPARILRAVLECWASLSSPSAVSYRAHRDWSTALPEMAVLIQAMLTPETSGVVFSLDPTGLDRVVIEATQGLAEAVVRGRGSLARYWASRQDGLEQAPEQGDISSSTDRPRVLTPEQVSHVARTSLALEHHFGRPQDVEWAFAQSELNILQSRPITTLGSSFFDDYVSDSASVWTAGFLNERFPTPVSPLGWTLVRELLEELALRDPLRFLGCRGVERLPITRLYRGHPYVNLAVFQTLYKVFPDSLLPEDAQRYFPDGRTTLRNEAPYPRSALDPRFLVSMTRHLLRRPWVWSPWHNHAVWRSFASEHAGRNQHLVELAESFEQRGGEPVALWQCLECAQSLSHELLALHRWSLTCADLTYSLLRRLLCLWTSSEEANEWCARLTTGLPNPSLDLDRDLCALAAENDEHAHDAALERFLQQHGHRSFSLDIRQPTFGDDPDQVDALLDRCRRSTPPSPEQSALVRSRARDLVLQRLGQGPLGIWKKALFARVWSLVQQYVPLREEQRFAWQKTLSVQRRLFLSLGKIMTAVGALHDRQHIFCLTKDEVGQWIIHQDSAAGLAGTASRRAQDLKRLEREHESSRQTAYPPFLRGNRPLDLVQPHATALRGVPVSPGVARGRVIVLRSSAELNRVLPGDVLVVPSVDSGWTPIFGVLSALVLEYGGQLSHSAIVAREYGLPAVAGIPGITSRLTEGEQVLVDGTRGVVTQLP